MAFPVTEKRRFPGLEEAAGSHAGRHHGLDAGVQVADHEAADEDAEENGHDIPWPDRFNHLQPGGREEERTCMEGVRPWKNRKHQHTAMHKAIKNNTGQYKAIQSTEKEPEGAGEPTTTFLS